MAQKGHLWAGKTKLLFYYDIISAPDMAHSFNATYLAGIILYLYLLQAEAQPAM